MKYIILTPAGSAYQRGNGNNPSTAIVSCRNWKWATKFNSPSAAIQEMKKEGRTRYRVVEYPSCTNVVIENGELLQQSYAQLPTVQSFFK